MTGIRPHGGRDVLRMSLEQDTLGVVKHIVLICVIGACGRGQPDNAKKLAEHCKLAHDGQSVTVVGYLAVPIMIGDCTKACTINLASTRDYTNDTLAIRLPIGNTPLTMNPLPPATTNLQQVGAGSFVVNDSDGKQRMIGERVQVAGTIRASMVKHRDYGLGGDGKEIETLQCSLEPRTIRASR